MLTPRVALGQIAEDERADVIVVGSRGHSQIADLFLGSVATYLTQHAKVPVLVIPAHAEISSP